MHCSSSHCDVVPLSLTWLVEALTVLVCVSCTGDGGHVFKGSFERRPTWSGRTSWQGLCCQCQGWGEVHTLVCLHLDTGKPVTIWPPPLLPLIMPALSVECSLCLVASLCKVNRTVYCHSSHIQSCMSTPVPLSISRFLSLFVERTQCPAQSCSGWPCRYDRIPCPQNGIHAPQHYWSRIQHGPLGSSRRTCWRGEACSRWLQLGPCCSWHGECVLVL